MAPDPGEGCDLSSHGRFITSLPGSGGGTVTSTPPSSPKYFLAVTGPSEFKSPDRAPGRRLRASAVTQAHEERLGVGREAGPPGSQASAECAGAPGAPYPL